MSKLPSLQFYFGDWKKDAELSMCSLSTRGFWFELLGAMHELGRSGQITGTAQQLARVCRCTAAEAEECIAELMETRAAEVTKRNEAYTIINRRMKREAKEREQTKERVQRFRQIKRIVTDGNGKKTIRKELIYADENAENQLSNANVTPISSSSFSTSNKNTSISAREFPIKEFCEAFPDIELQSGQIGMIQAEVKIEDKEAWLETIKTYKANYNRAANSYLPEKVGTVLNVFRRLKRDFDKEKQNGSHQRNIRINNKPTAASIIANRPYRRRDE